MSGAEEAGLTASINGEEAELVVGEDSLNVTLPSNPPGVYPLIIYNENMTSVYM